MPEPFFATRRVGVLNSLDEKAICSARCGVIDIDDSTPSNFFAFRAGIMPSKSFSTHTHFAFSRAQISLPRAMSKPTSLTSEPFDSNEWKLASRAKPMCVHGIAEWPAADGDGSGNRPAGGGSALVWPCRGRSAVRIAVLLVALEGNLYCLYAPYVP